MQLIGLTGKARAGKDTVADRLCSKYNFRRYALAGPLKSMLHAGLGLSVSDHQTTAQKEAVIPWLGVSYRHLAQTIGTEWMRKSVNPDGWLILCGRYIDEMRNRGAVGVVITDVRFENEAALIRRHGGQVWHVVSNRESGLQGAVAAHASEAGVTAAGGDVVVTNNSTIEALYAQADLLVCEAADHA